MGNLLLPILGGGIAVLLVIGGVCMIIKWANK